MPAAAAALIVKGAQLTAHCQVPSTQGEQAAQLLLGGDDGKTILLAGKPPDGEGKAEKPLAMIFVGQCGLPGCSSPKLN